MSENIIHFKRKRDELVEKQGSALWKPLIEQQQGYQAHEAYASASDKKKNRTTYKSTGDART